MGRGKQKRARCDRVCLLCAPGHPLTRPLATLSPMGRGKQKRARCDRVCLLCAPGHPLTRPLATLSPMGRGKEKRVSPQSRACDETHRPRPACGERVGVRGPYPRGLRPLTRPSATLSPMGRGEEKKTRGCPKCLDRVHCVFVPFDSKLGGNAWSMPPCPTSFSISSSSVGRKSVKFSYPFP